MAQEQTAHSSELIQSLIDSVSAAKDNELAHAFCLQRTEDNLEICATKMTRRRSPNLIKLFVCQVLLASALLGIPIVSAHADALDNWTSGVMHTNGYDPYGLYGPMITGAAYGNGRYVEVGQYFQTDEGIVETSSDGTNWVITSPYDDSILDLYDVTFANGIFVAVGWAGDGLNYNFYTSSNGSNWTSHVGTQIYNFSAVTFGGGQFVAVGDGYILYASGQTNENIYSSPDGTNWEAQDSGAPANDVDILFDVAYGAGTFVAVGKDASGSSYFHTATAMEYWYWTRTTSNYRLAGSISYCNGLFFAPSGPGTNLVSANGTTWAVRTNNTSSTFGRMIYTNGLYVALSGTTVFTSTDGTNWVQRNLHPPANEILTAAVFGNGTVVVVGYENNTINSPDLPPTFRSDPLVSLAINSGPSPQLKISGVSNLLYSIQYSPSLNPANWQTLTNFTLSNSPSIQTDGAATNSQRYYRAGWLP